MLLDLAQEPDGLHVSAVETESKPPSNGDEPNQPIVSSRHVNRKRNWHASSLGQNAHKADYVGARGLADKRLAWRQFKDLIGRADHHFGFERKPAKKFLAQLGLADRFPNDKSSCGTDVYYAEFGHLIGEGAGTESPVPANVHTL